MNKFLFHEELGELKIDKVFFEEISPIIFTCLNDRKELFLLVSYYNKGLVEKWILTKINNDIIIGVLSDKITLRNAFLYPNEKKYNITCNNGKYEVQEEELDKWKERENLNLPADEYMECDKGEFDEEIEYYSIL